MELSDGLAVSSDDLQIEDSGSDAESRCDELRRRATTALFWVAVAGLRRPWAVS